MKIATINQILATRSRATFPYRINFSEIAYSNVEAMNTWCENNCHGLWRGNHIYAIYWQFEDEKDAIMFMLKWGGSKGNNLK